MSRLVRPAPGRSSGCAVRAPARHPGPAGRAAVRRSWCSCVLVVGADRLAGLAAGQGDVPVLAGRQGDSFPAIASAFWVNVRMFLVAEPLILVVGVLVAVARGTVAPVLFPVRALAVALHRPVPRRADAAGGLPGRVRAAGAAAAGRHQLACSGWACWPWCCPTAPTSRRCSAPASRRVHPSQVASAQALGLSHAQSLRFVVVPQAVRRVVPPLLNDFVSLQKDTALVASVGLVEALRAGAGLLELQLQLLLLPRRGRVLRGADRSRWPG